ncbi:MAG: sigma-70 family RNA polymerase sigma factor [Rhizobiales bacterium]|nr:sigma-70 family RNA polymerase sigma factor [Hyphomicrobiales bacterium]
MSEGGQGELVLLMRRIAAGDRASFGLLYDRTSGKLFATIRRILGSGAAAEDAVQEAYVRIWRRAADFDPAIASPIAWMTTIARHVAIDMARRTSERISAAGDVIDADMADRLADPDADTERLAAGSGLARCLDRMEPDRRTMVLLAYCEGWSREELAERFNRPVATVKTLLRRSLILLKECLGG